MASSVVDVIYTQAVCFNSVNSIFLTDSSNSYLDNSDRTDDDDEQHCHS